MCGDACRCGMRRKVSIWPPSHARPLAPHQPGPQRATTTPTLWTATTCRRSCDCRLDCTRVNSRIVSATAPRQRRAADVSLRAWLRGAGLGNGGAGRRVDLHTHGHHPPQLLRHAAAHERRRCACLRALCLPETGTGPALWPAPDSRLRRVKRAGFDMRRAVARRVLKRRLGSHHGEQQHAQRLRGSDAPHPARHAHPDVGGLRDLRAGRRLEQLRRPIRHERVLRCLVLRVCD